jgi:hypothetical protein
MKGIAKKFGKSVAQWRCSMRWHIAACPGSINSESKEKTMEPFVEIKVAFPRRLLSDLQSLAKDAGISPAAFLSESGESQIASRRMAEKINVLDSFVAQDTDQL